ncbi:phage protease [uncultured Endozoicomonas sp.]|uniref:phage protease n=1 Tax=uncultured Endozoicomonas sp. TaxID=432652 RepID=UPI00260DFC52|nr:phage protease [uncultured Endozoicomonas sp.]
MKTSYLALNFSLTGDDALPERLELIPAGVFSGLDGRSWNNPFPEAVIDRTRGVSRDIPIDIEHATELKGPKGEAAPAQGWIRLDDLEVIDGAIWGAVEWNNSGRALLGDKAYRYYSPAFLFDGDGEVRSIKSVGLTNTQNLSQLPALNQQQSQQPEGGADDMSLPAAIRQALGLKEDANEADAVQAIGTLKTDHQVALNRAETPDAEKWVPTETHQLAQNRAESAEKDLATYRTKEMEGEVDAAIEAGKIAPANRDHYLAICRQEGGIDTFRALAKTMPKVVSTEAGVGGKKPEGDQQQSKISADELAICRDLGITEDEYLAARA